MLYEKFLFFVDMLFWIVGDVVNCGFGFFVVLCVFVDFGLCVIVVFGNYDFYLFVVFVGLCIECFGDIIGEIFDVFDVDVLFDWVCYCLFVYVEYGMLFVYVGVLL